MRGERHLDAQKSGRNKHDNDGGRDFPQIYRVITKGVKTNMGKEDINASIKLTSNKKLNQCWYDWNTKTVMINKAHPDYNMCDEYVEECCARAITNAAGKPELFDEFLHDLHDIEAD